MPINVAIARELGCGGSYIGQHVAARLGYRCVDREVVSRTANEFQIDEAEIAGREETVQTFWERMLVGFSPGPPDAVNWASLPSPTDRQLFDNETAVLKEIAAAENCVIVGRAATQTLPPHPGLITVFLHAPRASRIGVYMRRTGTTDRGEAETLIDRSDEMRRRFVQEMTGIDWSCARYYDLAMDTAKLGPEAVVEIVTTYVEKRAAGLKAA